MNTSKSILSFNEVTFCLPNTQQPFFKNLSISFQAGVLHRIGGKNGVGKSLFFRLIQGHFFKDENISGAITLHTKTYTLSSEKSLPISYTSHIASLPQKFDQVLADAFSSEDNLRCALLQAYPKLTPLPEYKPLPDFFKKFNIDLQKPMHLLSGGQRQIIAILMLLQKPKSILLLDEPTAALDPENAALVIEFLTELIEKTGITIFIISHEDEAILPTGTIQHTIMYDSSTNARNFRI